MKKLLIVRHAKSDWGSAVLTDFDRPLNPRGRQDAPMMGKRLQQKNIQPDLIVSSPANRALSTAKKMATELSIPENKIVTNKNIYEANAGQLLKIINQFEDCHQLCALFGHNNGVTDLAIYLSDADIYNLPTCGMVLITFPFDHWNMIGKDTGEMVFYDYPKNE